MEIPLPPKGVFTKQERHWIENTLIPAIKTTEAIKGRNTTIINDPEGKGQIINADDGR